MSFVASQQEDMDHPLIGRPVLDEMSFVASQQEDMDHPLIGRPVLDEMDFMASQHLDSVWDKFHLHDFSHIGEELLDMGK
jgi:hypothetical protein